MTTNTECKIGYERCRMRRSIHSIVSAFLFAIAIILLFRAVLRGDISQVSDPISGIGDEKLAKQFTMVLYFFFILPFALHWTRIYFSFIIIDEDPLFYKQVLHDLTLGQKRFEWVLRVFLLVVLVWFAERSTASAGSGAGDVFLLGYFFSPIVLIYSCLLLWDVFLLITAPIKIKIRNLGKDYSNLNTTEKDRIKYFSNDILGFLMSVALIVIESGIVSKNNIIYVTLVITVLMVISCILLLWDLIVNRRRYRKYVSNSILPHYAEIEIKCTGACPVPVGD